MRTSCPTARELVQGVVGMIVRDGTSLEPSITHASAPSSTDIYCLCPAPFILLTSTHHLYIFEYPSQALAAPKV